ncbi:hypothetical protein [Rubrivirga sp.]|uniref:hypothetical protein n=1 Tax=Rubrivirga sp. TaxID=1885344 RepID=UPI003B52116E
MTVSVERQLRRFLLATAAVTYLAAAVELLLVEHYEDVWQLAPFGLIAVGLAAVAWVARAPGSQSVRALWVAGGLAVAGSVLGVVLHVKGNAAFALEIEPDLGLAAATWEGLSGGNPLLAPGMVALAGVLGAAAGWRHPAADLGGR